MTEEELKNKCKERAKIFQQAMESCHSPSPIDCIEWFADRIAELEQLIEKMKCCGNCRFDYCERSSEYIDKDGNRTFHCWNEDKERYCDAGKNGKYQCWEIK